MGTAPGVAIEADSRGQRRDGDHEGATGMAMKPRQPSPSRRPRHPMPAFVRDALVRHGLREAYRARPPYQRNDYLGWIGRAKRPETRDKRLAQMLEELAAGNRYMKMPYRAGR